MAKTKNILFVCNSTASRLWRVLPQARHMKLRRDFDAKIVEAKKFYPDDMKGADIIVLQMAFDPKIFKDAKRKGIKIVFEIDDLLHWLPKDHYAKSKINLRWKWDVVRAINMADAVTVTNEQLYKTYRWLRPFKKNIHILPNYVDMQYWDKPHNPNMTDNVRIGYCGGKSHVNDLLYIKDVLVEVMNKYDNVKFVQCGAGGYSGSDPVTEYNYGKDLFKELPIEKREYSLGAPMMVWADKLNHLQLDIGLAPVVENKFSKAKTPIKFMEYGVNSVPSICSEFLYKDVIKHGYDGYLVKTEEEWYRYLCQLIENAPLRRTIGKRARSKVRKHYNLHEHLGRWELLYRSLID